jgi:uncharacterized protein (DUF1499 family)
MVPWQRTLLFAAIALVVAMLLWLALRGLVALISKRPPNLGVKDGRLAPCPAMPNCVSTQGEDERHRIDPIPYETSTGEARDRIVRILRSMPRTRIITDMPTYVYAEVRTAFLGHVDDVEFTFDENAGVIHFRSGSRLPYWDQGVNRRRMEAIRAAFESAE